MALITKPSGNTKSTVQQARHLAMPVIALGVIAAILFFARLFFITLIIAVIIAFILEPIVTLLMKARLPRSVASLLVCGLAILFLYVIAVGAYSQLSDVYEDLGTYGQRIGDVVDGVQQKIQAIEERTYKLLLPARQRREEQERLQAEQEAAKKRGRRGNAVATPPPAPPQETPPEERMPISEYVYSRLNSFYEVLLMASFIPFLVYFMLSWRDHINRSFLQLFHGEDRLIAARSMAGIAGMVRAFVVGNFLLWILLAFASIAAFWLIGLPYPLLVGPLSGLLSLIPYVGLPLAMAPPLLSALGINQFSLYVLVVVITSFLHLIALNLLYPKVVGSRVHLNPLVVMVSLMLWSFLWGAAGLLLAIPLTAGVKAVCDNVKDLRPFGKFLGD